jgi:hypothetical protein
MLEICGYGLFGGLEIGVGVMLWIVIGSGCLGGFDIPG